MSPVAARLKELRKGALPRLTVRQMADELEMPFGTYSFYESSGGFKKPHLPLDFARRVAAVLARRGVDPAEVMKLAGLDGEEAEPEARAVEAALPPVQFVSMSVALPSESALKDMFLSLLAAVPEKASSAEAAAILARHLPAGLAGIGPLAPDPKSSSVPASVAAPRSAARDHRES